MKWPESLKSRKQLEHDDYTCIALSDGYIQCHDNTGAAGALFKSDREYLRPILGNVMLMHSLFSIQCVTFLMYWSILSWLV